LQSEFLQGLVALVGLFSIQHSIVPSRITGPSSRRASSSYVGKSRLRTCHFVASLSLINFFTDRVLWRQSLSLYLWPPSVPVYAVEGPSCTFFVVPVLPLLDFVPFSIPPTTFIGKHPRWEEHNRFDSPPIFPPSKSPPSSLSRPLRERRSFQLDRGEHAGLKRRIRDIGLRQAHLKFRVSPCTSLPPPSRRTGLEDACFPPRLHGF